MAFRNVLYYGPKVFRSATAGSNVSNLWSPETIRIRFFKTETGEISYIKWVKYRGEILKLWPGMPSGLFFVNDIVQIKSGRFKGQYGKVSHIFLRRYSESECVYLWVKIKEEGRYYNEEIFFAPGDLELIKRNGVTYSRKRIRFNFIRGNQHTNYYINNRKAREKFLDSIVIKPEEDSKTG